MSRSFQFSLARALIAVALLSSAFALARLRLRNTRAEVVLWAAAGLLSATSVGVLCRRTQWLALGAIIGIMPGIWYFFLHIWWQPTF